MASHLTQAISLLPVVPAVDMGLIIIPERRIKRRMPVAEAPMAAMEDIQFLLAMLEAVLSEARVKALPRERLAKQTVPCMPAEAAEEVLLPNQATGGLMAEPEEEAMEPNMQWAIPPLHQLPERRVPEEVEAAEILVYMAVWEVLAYA